MLDGVLRTVVHRTEGARASQSRKPISHTYLVQPSRHGSARVHLTGGDIELIALRSERSHRLEAAVGEEIAVELDAIAVRIVEVDAPRDVVRDRRLDGDA